MSNKSTSLLLVTFTILAYLVLYPVKTMARVLSYGDVTISTTTVWESTDTVRMSGRLRFESGTWGDYDTLFIQPGARVEMGNSSILEIIGAVLYSYSETDSIRFRPISPNQHGGRFLIRDSTTAFGTCPATASFRNCSFDSIGSPVPEEGFIQTAGNTPELKLQDCWVRNVTSSGILFGGRFQNDRPDTSLYIKGTRLEGRDTSNSFDGIRLEGDSLPWIGCAIVNSHIRNFGYSPGTELTTHQGAAICVEQSSPMTTLHVSGSYPGLPFISNCGHGIRSTRGNSSLFLHQTSAQISQVSGCGIYIDEFKVYGFVANSSIQNTALDGIRIWRRDTTRLTNDQPPDSIVVSASTLKNIGALRQPAMTSQSNGLVVVGGGMYINFYNSVIDSVYSNGVRLYTETDDPLRWARNSQFRFIRNAQPLSWQGNPLDPSRSPACYITHCGIDTFTGVTPFTRSIDQFDERHGIRLGYQPRDAADSVITFEYIKLFDVGIGYCRGAGLAIRGDGWIRDSIRSIARLTTLDNNYYHGRIDIFGSMISRNGIGIDANGNMHGLGIYSQGGVGHDRAVISSISRNDSSGISFASRQGSNSILRYNKIHVLGESDNYAVFIDSNRTGGINFYENDASAQSGLIANCIKSEGGFRVDGYVMFDPGSNDHGVSFASDYADSNNISLLHSYRRVPIITPPAFGKDDPDTIWIQVSGSTLIRLHSKNGIYLNGKTNTLVGGLATIVSNLANGIMLDERATTTTIRTSLGQHTVTLNQCTMSSNGKNGVYVVSDSARSLPRSSFGGSSVSLASCWLEGNSTINLGAEHSSGVWIDEAGGSFYAAGCSFRNSPQSFGFRQSSISHTDQINGGYLSSNTSHGLFIDSLAYNIQLSLTLNNYQSVVLVPSAVSVIGVGPLIANNGGAGLKVARGNGNRQHTLNVNASSFIGNQQNGFHLDCDINRLDLNSNRFYQNQSTANILLSSINRPTFSRIVGCEIVGGASGIQSAYAPNVVSQNIIHNASFRGLGIEGMNGGQSVIAHNTIICDSSNTGSGLKITVPDVDFHDNIIQIFDLIQLGCINTTLPANNVRYNLVYCVSDSDATWGTLTTVNPIGTNVIGNPKVYSEPDTVVIHEGVRYHIVYPSVAINNGDPSLDARDANGTRANIGAFGGRSDTLGLAKLWRANTSCLLMPDSGQSNIQLSGTLKSEQYYPFSRMEIANGDTLRVEPGIDMYLKGNVTDGDSFIVHGVLQNTAAQSSPPPLTLKQMNGTDTDSMWLRLTPGEFKIAVDGSLSWSETGRWGAMVIMPFSGFGGTTFERLWLVTPRHGLRLLGPEPDTSFSFQADTLSLRKYRLTNPHGAIGLTSGLYIKHRRALLNHLELLDMKGTSNPAFGVWAERDTVSYAPLTIVSIDSSIMRRRVNHDTPFIFVYVKNLGGCPDEPTGNKITFWMSNTKIDSITGEGLSSDSASGIYIVNTLFYLYRDTVVNINNGNALRLAQIGYDHSRNVIQECRFSGSGYDNGFNGLSELRVGNGVYLHASFPEFYECEIDHNKSNGILSYWNAGPYFWNRPSRRGTLIHDNAIGSDSAAQYYQLLGNFTQTPAPYIVWNSIYSDDNARLVVRDPMDDLNPVPANYQFNGVWWGTTSDSAIYNRMYRVDEENQLLPAWLFRNPLPHAPWEYGPYQDTAVSAILDAFRSMEEGDYPTAASLLSDVINDESQEWHFRAHAVPLLFGVNNERGWTFEQNYALQESLQTRFEGTDMYEPVRNYKPLLDLLYNDPKQAYETYQQFQLFPLCFEDSVAAVIAMLELDPVMGPESKRGGYERERAVAENLRRISELEQLLFSRRGTGGKTAANPALPLQYELRNPYPNPFNSIVSFHFSLPKTGFTKYIVYDVLGREVYRREMGSLHAGKYLASWNGRNTSGSLVGSGVYFLRFQSSDFQQVKKVVMVK